MESNRIVQDALRGVLSPILGSAVTDTEKGMVLKTAAEFVQRLADEALNERIAHTLVFRFTNSSPPELTKISVLRQYGTPLIAVRGKTDRVTGDSPSFQWTRAVQALAVLAVKTVMVGCPVKGSLTGERGSAAAALDFAIGKPPRWLQELFGNSTRPPAAFFSRINPERKHAGPVVVGFNPARISVQAIQVELDARRVEDPHELQYLLAGLEGLHAHEDASGSCKSKG